MCEHALKLCKIDNVLSVLCGLEVRNLNVSLYELGDSSHIKDPQWESALASEIYIASSVFFPVLRTKFSVTQNPIFVDKFYKA